MPHFLAGALLLALSSLSTPAGLPPDFSGTWRFDGAKSRVAAIASNFAATPVFGEEFTAKQDAATLTLDIVAGPTKLRAVYRLDGTESQNLSPPAMGGPDVVVTARASWEGDRLVIRSKSVSMIGGKETDVESTRTLSLNVAGDLIVDRIGTAGIALGATSVYRRVSDR